jgi:hypothetical protein
VSPVSNDLVLEIRNRIGRGVAVLVEGNDRWIYEAWFPTRDFDVTFFNTQKGWYEVENDLHELKQELPRYPIYAILDRDFADSSRLTSGLVSDGIVRTRRYTLENYLLEPACWAEVFKFLHRLNPARLGEWSRPEFVAQRIEEACRQCIPVAAHNAVVAYVRTSFPDVYDGRSYRDRTDATVDMRSELRQWGDKLGINEDIGERYTNTVARYEALALDELHEVVTGKCVVANFLNQVPTPLGGRPRNIRLYNQYLQECPNAPDDIVEAVERIMAVARRRGWRG